MIDRRGALKLLGGTLVGAAGCAAPDRPVRDTATRAPIDLPVRATLWAKDIVLVTTPQPTEVVAYVSMAARHVYVDRSVRDRASWLLRAHISVSTWHWRIPLAGDAPGVPISPGDELREFEELDISLWDPSLLPAMDDIRIVRGALTPHRIVAQCTPIEGAPSRALTVSSEIVLGRAAVPGGSAAQDVAASSTVREDFHPFGLAEARAEGCREASGDVVQLVGWAARSG